MASTVNVENISKQTSEDEIKSFFSFCGKIQSLSVKPTGDGTQSASVTFEKAAAAKTALLLDNTQLGPNSVNVSSTKSIDEIAGDKSTSAEEAQDGDHHPAQEDKPRARVLAEYLAHGYVISNNAIENALAFDQKNGYSEKFRSFIKNVDQKTQATQTAQNIDQKLGVTQKGSAAWNMMASYFDKAAGTPTGQKLRGFYDSSNKTVMDVHNEAKHLADLKKQKPTDDQAGATTAQHSEKAGSDSYAAAAAPTS